MATRVHRKGEPLDRYTRVATVAETMEGIHGMLKKTFYLAASHRQIKRKSLRPSRLCGEDLILDRLDRRI